MEIREDTWHCKIYRKWLILNWKASQGIAQVSIYNSDKIGWDYYKPEVAPLEELLSNAKSTRTHNLCLYMRAVLIWGPMRICWSSHLLWAIIGTISAWTLASGAYVWSSMIPQALLAILDVFVAFCIIIGASYPWRVQIDDKLTDWCGTLATWLTKRRKLSQERKQKSFLSTVAIPYLKSRKKKMCPTIEIKSN